MSSASAPRTSPTMMRSGRMRSELRTSSRIGISPSPSMFLVRLESKDVPLVEPQLGRVLDRDDAILVRDRRRHRVQQGRLTGTRAARDEDVQLCSDALLEEVDGFAAERAEPDQVVKAPALVPELADRHEWA